MNLGSPTSTSAVNWTRVSIRTQNQQPLTWYKANFDAPEGDEPLALDIGSMGKGEVRIALEDTGLFMLMVTAALAVILVHSGLTSANLVVSNRLNNGIMFLGLGSSHPKIYWWYMRRLLAMLQ